MTLIAALFITLATSIVYAFTHTTQSLSMAPQRLIWYSLARIISATVCIMTLLQLSIIPFILVSILSFGLYWKARRGWFRFF